MSNTAFSTDSSVLAIEHEIVIFYSVLNASPHRFIPPSKMKHSMVAVTLFCSVSGSRTLKAGDDHAFTDGFTEALLRQLKVMPPAKCRCPDGYVLHDGTCIQSIEVEAQVNRITARSQNFASYNLAVS